MFSKHLNPGIAILKYSQIEKSVRFFGSFRTYYFLSGYFLSYILKNYGSTIIMYLFSDICHSDSYLLAYTSYCFSITYIFGNVPKAYTKLNAIMD
jgi:hypothetical protein